LVWVGSCENPAPHGVPLSICSIAKQDFVRAFEVAKRDCREDVMDEVVSVLVTPEQKILNHPTMAVSRHQEALVFGFWQWIVFCQLRTPAYCDVRREAWNDPEEEKLKPDAEPSHDC